MTSSERSQIVYENRFAKLDKWNESETGKAPSHRSSQQFTIKFEYGAMLLAAVAAGDLEETCRLIKEGADVNYANIDGLTALHQACIDDNFPMVKILIDNGADVGACDNENWTPLHAAASSSSLEIIKFIVARGADVAAVNSDAELPIDLTESNATEDYLENEMKRHGVDAVEAREAEERLMLADVEKWRKEGKIDDKIKDSQGATPLHVAASKGYLEVASTLLSIGADPNIRDNDGWTPLHAAIHWKYDDICKILLVYGADPKAPNNLGDTPTQFADEEFEPIINRLISSTHSRKQPSATAMNWQSNIPSCISKSTKTVVGILKTSNKETAKYVKSIPTPTRPTPRPISLPSTPKSETVAASNKPVIPEKSPIHLPTRPSATISTSNDRRTVPKPSNITTPASSNERKSALRPMITRPVATPKAEIMKANKLENDSNQTLTLGEAMEKIGKLEVEVTSWKNKYENLNQLVEQLKIKNTTVNETLSTPLRKPVSRPPK